MSGADPDATTGRPGRGRVTDLAGPTDPADQAQAASTGPASTRSGPDSTGTAPAATDSMATDSMATDSPTTDPTGPASTEPASAGTGPVGLGTVGWARWFWRTLTSMRTALILLFLFALASIPGSIWPQRGVSDAKVAQYFTDSPQLAEWLDRFWLFDVFKAPWFAAIYLLLFVSLIGCVLPRTTAHLRELRRKPPAAPRNLSRLPQHASFAADLTVEAVAARLRAKRFRVTTGPGWVAAEKGYLRETGNLLFHVALVGLLVAIGMGALYGYRGNVLVVEGEGFANTVAAYDRYMPGQQVSAESLKPFSFTVEDFRATYIAQGEKTGQPLDFEAALKVVDAPGAAERDYVLKVNEPLDVDGTLTYLIDHGYAPTFKITDGSGQVAFDGPVPCLVVQPATFTSECVIKVPDARPEQLGLLVGFLPTTVPAGDEWVSVFPGAANPTAQVYGAFAGDLGLDDGRPQSVYEIDPERLKKMKPLVMKADPLAVGKKLDLPGGAGSIEFTGVREWIALQIAYDPGRMPALVASVVAVVGLVLSLTVHRRRVWVRIRDAADEPGGPAAEDGRPEGALRQVEVGGLTRTEGGDFSEEFAGIVSALNPGVKDAR
ncbi:cytochrome c biogenesis protein [Streptosporangium becharense]|uniref:Cytochrome c biogenesis protein n=1 Tax=Streptosporangium becharense TaxID=1816182 RepID=A0A7W9MGZ6_9ACTN|nr:cytochrome c biogenesis protein ResB [Streptosporangium becharense]MBB2909038.1 cytochrome c biogenesis protein [Streptosporangium becharense]MBB5819944.1 cytochrome c biogenesis protein [Streptosporangium becharense]